VLPKVPSMYRILVQFAKGKKKDVLEYCRGSQIHIIYIKE
jgi:hypothetical protein